MRLPRANYEKLILLFVSLLLFIYMVIRAILVPMGHDEVATFFYYVQTGNASPFQFHNDANNHILNSFLTWIFYSMFGNSPFVLRLANLLFVPVFFWFSYKLSTLIKGKALQYFFLTSLWLAQNFMEFFGLSRGYGMSMALFTGSLWFLFCFAKSRKIKDLAVCLVLISLAVLANLTLVNTLILMTGLFIILVLSGKKTILHKGISFAVILLAGIAPLVFFGLVLFRMRSAGDLYSGSNEGFWDSTLLSLVRLLFNAGTVAGNLFLIYVLGISAILAVLAIMKNKTGDLIAKPGMLMFLLLIGNAAGTIAVAKIFHVNYPSDRLGLYFFPLITGTFIFLLSESEILQARHFSWLLAIPLVIIPLHLFFHINATYAACSKDDNIPKRFYDKIEASRNKNQFPPTVGSKRQGHFAWSYLTYRHGGNLGQEYWTEFPGDITDFLIATSEDWSKVKEKYDSVDFNEISGKYLLKRKSPHVMKTVYSRTGIATPGMISSEYFTISEGPADTLAGKSLYIGCDLQITSEQKPFLAWIVTEIHDKEGKVLDYEFIALEWLKVQWNGETGRFFHTMPVYNLPATASKYVTYIWNEKKAPFRIEDGRFSIFVVPD